MSTWHDVERFALSLPATTAGKENVWTVLGTRFMHERPLRPADRAALGADAPDGPVLAAWVADEETKHELVASSPGVYFTTPHFDGYAMVLVRLDAISTSELYELVFDAWAARAPQRLVAKHAPPSLWHLALAHEWADAVATGEYARSTRGRGIDEVGFVHLSYRHQLAATAGFVFAGEDAPLTLLEISRQVLAVAGVDVREEPGNPHDQASERYPHAFGPLPTSAVVTATPARMVDGRLVVDRDLDLG